MVNTNLKIFTYGYYDVNDKGYLTELIINVEAYDRKEAINIIYQMDENDQIDYTKARSTRKKYKESTREDEDDEYDLLEFVYISEKYKYPYHKTGLIKKVNDVLTIDIVALIDSLTDYEQDHVLGLLNELKK